jgi:hypothetical protein
MGGNGIRHVRTGLQGESILDGTRAKDIGKSTHKNETYRTLSSVAKNSPIRRGCDASYKIALTRPAELRGCRWFCVLYLLLDQRMQLITNIKTNIDLATALDMAVEVKEMTKFSNSACPSCTLVCS